MVIFIISMFWKTNLLFSAILIFYCGKNTSHEVYLLNTFSSVQYPMLNHRHSVLQPVVVRAYSSCITDVISIERRLISLSSPLATTILLRLCDLDHSVISCCAIMQCLSFCDQPVSLSTPVFTVALFTIAKIWEQPKCPSKQEWIQKMWYLHTMEYHSVSPKQGNSATCDNMNQSGRHYEKWNTLALLLLKELMGL